MTLDIGDRFKRVASPYAEEDDGLGRNCSRFLSKMYMSVGETILSPRTGKQDFYLFPESLKVVGLTEALNTLGHTIGDIFVVASKAVAYSKEGLALRERISRIISRIDEGQLRLVTKSLPAEMLVWGRDDSQFKITNDCVNFRSLAPRMRGAPVEPNR